MEREIEFFRKREKHRQTARNNLPPNLQLEFPQKKPEKEKWSLGGRLLKLRHSQEPADILFIESLRLEIKNRLNKEITKEEWKKIEELKEIIKKEREHQVLYLDNIVITEVCLKECFDKDWSYPASQIAIELAKLGAIATAKTAMKECFDAKNRSDLAGQIAIELAKLGEQGMIATAKVAMERCFDEGLHDKAVLIARELAKLGEIEIAKAAMERCLNKDWSDSAGQIAIELAKLGEQGMIATAKTAVGRCFVKNRFYPAGQIAIELAKLGEQGMIATAKAAMERCLDKDLSYSAGQIAIELAKLGEIATAKVAVRRCFAKNRFDSAGQIARELAKLGEIEIAKAAMERCFDAGLFYSAGQIARELAKLGEIATAKAAMERCFDKDWSDSVGQIARELAKLGEIEIAKAAMERCFDASSFYSAGQIAIELAKLGEQGMITTAKAAMERCFAEGLHDKAGQIAIELAKLGEIEIAKAAMERCFAAKNRADLAGQIAIELAKLGKKPQKIIEILDKLEIAEKDYSYKIIVHLLTTNQDLSKLLLEYLPQFRVIKEYGKEINQELLEEKKIDNPEKFFQNYQAELAKLHFLDLNLSNRFLSQTLKNHGFPRLERYFKNVIRKFNPEPLKEVLAKVKNLDPEYFSRLIEISSAYQRMDLGEKLKENLQENTKGEISAQELIKILGQNILEEFSKKLKIEGKIKENTFDKWNLEYLPRLFTAEASYKEDDKELLRLIMKISFQEESFLPVLFGKIAGEYTEDEQERLDEIQNYNLKIKEEFEKEGLDFEKWLTYQGKKEFKVGQTEDQLKTKRESFERELTSTIKQLLGSYREKRKGILSDKEAKTVFNKVIKKYGIQLKEGEIIHPEKGKLSLRDVGLILTDFIQEIERIYQKEKNERKKEDIATALDHLKNLKERLPDLEKELLRKGFELEVKLWQREPGYDIFQGDYTHCCVAVEHFNRGAMLDYLVDTNLQVVEIRDKAEDKTITQTWLFVVKDTQGNLNLVLDNVEIHSDYSGLEPQIRENLFEYVREYTKSFSQGKIKRILIGANSYNDVKTEGLDPISLTQTKIAGAPRETEYLEAFGSAWTDPSIPIERPFCIVAEDLDLDKEPEIKGRTKKKKKKPEITIEEITQPNSELINQINQLEETIFPEKLQTQAEEYLDMKGLHLILRKEKKVIGNLSAVETEEVPSLVDKNHLNKDTLYVWTIAIKPEGRGLKIFSRLIKEFIQKAKEKGIKKLVMHARVNEHLSDVLQKRYGAKKIRREENWLDSGEPFDYLEIDLENGISH